METQELKAIFERRIRELEGVKAGLEIVTAIETLEQSAKDIQAKIKSLNEEHDRVLTESRAASGVVESAKSEAKGLVLSSKVTAAEIEKRAETKAEAIISKAEEKARQIEASLSGIKSKNKSEEAINENLREQGKKLRRENDELEAIKQQARQALGI